MRCTTLRDLITVHGASQRDIAECAGISEQYLSDLVCGRRQSPGFSVLVRLADVLDTSVAIVTDALLRSIERRAADAESGEDG